MHLVRREWEPEDLIASWTLVKPDWGLVVNKTGATRLGFGVLLKLFEIDGRFPEYAAEVPDATVAYVAEQVKGDPALFARYDPPIHTNANATHTTNQHNQR